MYIQWNPSKIDAVGPSNFVYYSKVSLIEGFCYFILKMYE